MFPIQDIDNITLAFPANVSHLMPAYKDIPEEFKRPCGKWQDVVSAWFFCGLKNAKWTPKEGVDTNKALRHVKTIMGSFEPKHEHKEAGCAYLLSQWFDDVTYEKAKALTI